MERYKVAMHKAGIADYGDAVANATWYSRIKEDYQIEKSPSRKDPAPSLAKNDRKQEFSKADWSRSMEALNELAGLTDEQAHQYKMDGSIPGKGYTPPVTVSADGKTAYFSKAVYIKPEYGIFSKKDLVHKIYKAENINGQWMNVTEIGVCPQVCLCIASVKIFPDGQRLFFASDMPGTFGKYDIYVAEYSKGWQRCQNTNTGRIGSEEKRYVPKPGRRRPIYLFVRDGYGGLDLFV